MEELRIRIETFVDVFIRRVEHEFPAVETVCLFAHAATVIALGRAVSTLQSRDYTDKMLTRVVAIDSSKSEQRYRSSDCVYIVLYSKGTGSSMDAGAEWRDKLPVKRSGKRLESGSRDRLERDGSLISCSSTKSSWLMVRSSTMTVTVCPTLKRTNCRLGVAEQCQKYIT